MNELIFTFFQSYIGAILFNGLFAVLAYVVFWKLLARKLAAWRIQIERRADAKQLKRELKNAVFVFAVAASMNVLVTWLGQLGYTKIYLGLSEQPIWYGLLGFPILLIIDDAWFYWVHRALHHPRIYKYVHHEHHRSLDVNPITSVSFHWLEPLLLSLWVVPVSLVFPVWAPVLALLQVYGLLDNIKSHLGYEIFPSWWNKSPLRFLTSSTYHNLHHTKFRGNYGVHFRFWDRLMGTELAEYEPAFDDVQGRKLAAADAKQAL